MSTYLRRTSSVMIALLAAAPSVIGGLAAAAPVPPFAARDGVWPQSYSDVAPDPDARFGRLANGMRYVILRNATPKGQASLRLRIGAGSLDETDAQQGVAHLLEHMAFKGSTHVPEGEMVKILERRGLAFGPDTNAQTSWTETVYMLDLPEASDPGALDTGLMLLRETGGELTLSDHALSTERGVVLSEERLRDTPSYRAAKAQLGFWLAGQKASERFPIGKVKVIQTIPAPAVKAFWQAHYRPDDATLVVVGDIDPAAVEAQVKARFGDWRATASQPAPPALGQVARRGLQTRIVVQPGAATQVQLAWIAPFDTAPDTLAKRRHDLVEQLGLAVLNRRLERLARGSKPPFISAGAFRQDVFRSAKVTALQISSQPDGWRAALEGAETARRRLAGDGLRQAELDREVVEARTALQAQVAGAATRRTPALAGEIVSGADDQQVFTSPAQDLALFEQAVKGLTAKEAADAVRAAFGTGADKAADSQTQGPLVTLTTPTPLPAGAAGALAAAYAAAEAAPLSADAADATATWPYTDFGKPGKVAERREVADLGVTFVRFANGVRLTVKPTAFRKDQVLVTAGFGHGLLDLPKDKSSPTWAASALVEGGMKRISLEDAEATLADRVAGASFSVDEDAFELSGTTRPADLTLQLQLLAAYATEPGFRPEAFERTRTAYLAALPQLDATPQGVLQKTLSQAVRSGDARWAFPTRGTLEASKPDDLRAMAEPPLETAPVEVVVVGDTTVEAAVGAVAATFGALPPRPDRAPSPGADQVRFPAPDAGPLKLTHTGRADQAVAYAAWPATDLLSDLKTARRVRLAQEVLQLRLTDKVRINQGLSYSPAARTEASVAFPGYGYVAAQVETPPTKLAGFFADLDALAADLAAKGPTPDELARAKAPRIEAVLKLQQTNEYWRAALGGAQADPRRLEAARTAVADLQSATAADIQSAAARYLTPKTEWRATVTAAGTK